MAFLNSHLQTPIFFQFISPCQRIALVLFLSVFCFHKNVRADEVIEISEEELAEETVLPVFDRTVVVRDRAVTTKGRVELGVGLGLSLVEALYDPLVFTGHLGYHFTEVHGLILSGIFFNSGLSGTGKDLQDGRGLTGRTFDASRAPSPEYIAMGNYQFTAYYGKMSIAKQTEMHLGLYGLLGAGVISWGDATNPLINFGVGQKFYFNKNFAFRLDLQFAAYEGPDPTSPKDSPDNLLVKGGNSKKSSDFKQDYYFRSYFTGGIAVLF